MINLEHLPNQERNEKTVLFLRRHWVDLVHVFIFTLAMLAVPVALGIALSFGDTNIFDSTFWGSVSILLLSTYLLVVLVITISQLTDYFLDMWIVTNERIINTEQHGLFRRKVSEMRLNQVQDISSEMRGFLETFLTFGDVTIQTAGARLLFHFKNIDNPDDVKLTIARLVAECKKRHGDASAIAQPKPNHEL